MEAAYCDGCDRTKKKCICDKDVNEEATGGSTSAGHVSVGAIYKNKAAKQAKNKDGTAKNALDLDVPLMTGGSVKR